MSDDTSKVGPGTVLADRYELTAEIGRGGFGMVYQARQLNMDRDVAIKILPQQFMSIPDVVERFKREAKLASRLRHPNTITLHDYGQHEESLFIVMELLKGEDVADLLKREGRLKPDRILHISKQVLKSLAEAHEHNIVHRDLKPENIFLSVVGDDHDFVKVLDFGIAKLALPDLGDDAEAPKGYRKLTMSGSTVGTPTYMSPEQAAGEEVDGQTDLYALGIIMYEMACGRPPFYDKKAVKLMRSHLFEEVPPLPDQSLHGTLLEKVIFKALHKEKGRRFRTANEFLLALAGEPVAKPVVKGVDLTSLSEPSTTEWVPDDEDGSTRESPDTGDIRLGDGPSTDRMEGQGEYPQTLQSAEAVSNQEPDAARSDSIPFDSLGPRQAAGREKATVRSNITDQSGLAAGSGEAVQHTADSSLVDAPPPGFDVDQSSTGSSILTVIEPGDEEDDVILLTTPKEQPSESAGEEREQTAGAGRDTSAAPKSSEPASPGPASSGPASSGPASSASGSSELSADLSNESPPAASQSGPMAEAAPEELASPGPDDSNAMSNISGEVEDEEWSWGAGPVDTSSHDAIDSVGRSSGSAWLVALLVLAALAASAWFFRSQLTALLQ